MTTDNKMMGEDGIPLTRKQAHDRGVGTYIAKNPCRVNPGHGNIRYTGNGCCAKCDGERVRAWKKERPEKVKEYDRKYRESRPGYDVIRCKNFRELKKDTGDFMVAVREAGLND